MKKGEIYELVHRENGQKREIKILSRAGKAKSKRLKDSHNIKVLDSGQINWIDLREYRDFRRIPEEEEVLLGGFHTQKIMESRMRKIENWERNKVFEEVKNVGQKAINTCWLITEKIKGGETVCKASLIARGFEEERKDMVTDAPTCAPETLKLCIAKILQEGWVGGFGENGK